MRVLSFCFFFFFSFCYFLSSFIFWHLIALGGETFCVAVGKSPHETTIIQLMTDSFCRNRLYAAESISVLRFWGGFPRVVLLRPTLHPLRQVSPLSPIKLLQHDTNYFTRHKVANRNLRRLSHVTAFTALPDAESIISNFAVTNKLRPVLKGHFWLQKLLLCMSQGRTFSGLGWELLSDRGCFSSRSVERWQCASAIWSDSQLCINLTVIAV